MVNLNVRLDESEHQKLIQGCQSRSCDKSSLVRDALREYLSKLDMITSAESEEIKEIQAGSRSKNAEPSKVMARTVKITRENGTVDVYHDGKLSQTNIPPKNPCDYWTVLLP